MHIEEHRREPRRSRVLLTYADLRARGIRLSKTQLWRLVRAGKFPPPVQITAGGRNCWLEDEIDAHLESRIAARERGTA
jgi:prophage regulatory protein